MRDVASYYDLKNPEVLKKWASDFGYKPYALAVDYSDEEVRQVEIISWPYWENDKLMMKVRSPEDETTLRTVEWPQLTIVPKERP